MGSDKYSSGSQSFFSGVEGLGTRTPIKFGLAIKKATRTYMPDYTEALNEITDDYLIYIFKRLLANRWFCFILFQGARNSGRFTVEIGMSRRTGYPYYWGSMLPIFYVDNVRERLGMLIQKKDFWWEYKNQEQLEKHLIDVCREHIGRGFYSLLDMYQYRLETEIDSWNNQYRIWKKQTEKYADKAMGERYPELSKEKEAYDYIKMVYNTGSYDKIIGPDITVRALDENWICFQTYVMSKILEQGNIAAIAKALSPEFDIRDDAVEAILERIPPTKALVPLKETEDQIKRYSFFKALSAVEAVFIDEDFTDES